MQKSSKPDDEARAIYDRCIMDPRPAVSWAPSPWFLTSPPQTIQNETPRPRLFLRIDGAVQEHGMAVLAAPSGYGKTVVLTSWAQQQADPIAWLTLTHHERADEDMVLTGILSALTRVDGMSPDHALHTPDVVSSPADPRTLIGRIAAITATAATPVTIVIDDAHHAGPVLARGIVDVLQQATSGQLRFVLAGTPALLSWFSKTLSHSPNAALGAGDLAMTAEEIQRLAAGRNIPGDAAAAELLHTTSGGWPIAVQMHFLGTSGSASANPWQPDLLTDYIDAHVLPNLGSELREFVLAATTCSRVNPELAAALSGNTRSGTLLEECIREGLFLTRFTDDEGRVMYRWHDRFAEACRQLVERTSLARSRELDTVAATTLAPRYPVEGLQHAVRAEAGELAIDIIRSSWLRLIVETGARVLNASCVSLPEDLAETSEILIIRACCLNLLGDRTGARFLAASALAQNDDSARFRETHAFAQMFLADEPADLIEAVDHARRVVDSGAANPGMHAYRLFLLGWTELRLRRRPREAITLLSTARREAVSAHRRLLAKRAGSNLLFALTYAGCLRDAEKLQHEDFDTESNDDAWQHYDGSIGLFAVGFGEYWRGNLDAAEQHLRTVVDRENENPSGKESYSALARVYLAFIAAARATPTAIRSARGLLSGISDSPAHGVPWPLYRTIALADLQAAAGRYEQAVTLITPIQEAKNVPLVRTSAAEIARRAGQHKLAFSLLGGLTEGERSVSFVAASAETIAALIAYEHHDTHRAHLHLERALDAADREGILRPFLSTEPRMRELLTQHSAAGSAHQDFVASVLTMLGTTDSDDLTGSALSTREREIFGYLGTAMTAGEIADALFVSVNTVRTHQRAIYRKLGVTNRRDAVKLRL